MPPKSELLQKRYAQIRKEFEQLREETEAKQVRKYTYEEVLNKLANDHCYTPKTIENICTGKVGMK